MNRNGDLSPVLFWAHPSKEGHIKRTENTAIQMKKILTTIAIAASAALVTGSYVHAEEELTPEGRAGWFYKADTDKSGDITLVEFTVIMKEKGTEAGEIPEAFSKMDADSDGVLSEEECMKKNVAEEATEENH